MCRLNPLPMLEEYGSQEEANQQQEDGKHDSDIGGPLSSSEEERPKICWPKETGVCEVLFLPPEPSCQAPDAHRSPKGAILHRRIHRLLPAREPDLGEIPGRWEKEQYLKAEQSSTNYRFLQQRGKGIEKIPRHTDCQDQGSIHVTTCFLFCWIPFAVISPRDDRYFLAVCQARTA
jgi:hypothetical protein